MNKIPADLPAKSAAKKKSLLAKLVAFSPIWIFPVAAIAIGLSLLWKEYKTAGIPITVRFQSAAGIEVNKTLVKFRGVTAGKVVGLSMNSDYSLDVEIEMDHRSEPILVRDSEFWLVKPNISVNGITGLDTILSGSYITLKPGNQIIPSRSFRALNSAPPGATHTDGLVVTLKADSLGSLKVGSPVHFKKIPVGKISAYRLIDNNKKVEVQLFIDREHSHLVRASSVFWQTGSIELKAGLSGFNLRTDSMMSMLTGGISFTSLSDQEQDAGPLPSFFTLHDDYKKAQAGVEFELTTKDIAIDHLRGLPIMYRTSEVGYISEVKNTATSPNPKTHVLKAYLNPSFKEVLNQSARFWLESPKVSFGSLLNLEYLTKGTYVTFSFDQDLSFIPDELGQKKRFKLYKQPALAKAPAGYRIVNVVGKSSDTTQVDTKIFVNNEIVGKIVQYGNHSQESGAQAKAILKEYYADRLIKNQSFLFFKSPIELRGGIRNYNIRVAPLDEIAQYSLYLSQISNQKQKNPADAIEVFDSEESGKYRHSIDLVIENADGLISNHTPILWQGVQVGMLGRFVHDYKNGLIKSQAKLSSDLFRSLNNTSFFYKAEAKFSVTGIKDVESLMSGTHIRLHLGDGSGQKATDYRLQQNEHRAKTLTVRWRTNNPPAVGNRIVYKGIKVGVVTKVTLSSDLGEIVTEIELDRKYPDFYRSDTKFWLKQSKVSLSGIENGAALLGGPEIGVSPGKSSQTRNNFLGFESIPAQALAGEGILITIKSAQNPSVGAGSPLNHKGIKIGEIVEVNLDKSSSTIIMTALVYKKHQHFINKETKLWSGSGIDFSFGLFSGLKVKTASIESLLTGGISLSTPRFYPYTLTNIVPQSYELANEPEDEWLEWSPRLDNSQNLIAH